MKIIEFIYRNHKGETELRRVRPTSLDFIKAPGYAYQPGWHLTGYDVVKDAVRSFRLSHIVLDGHSTSLLARLELKDG